MLKVVKKVELISRCSGWPTNRFSFSGVDAVILNTEPAVPPRCAESISLRHAIVVMKSQSSNDDLLGFSTRFGVLGHTILNLTVFQGRFSMEAKDMRRGRLCRLVMPTTVAVSISALMAAIPATAQNSKPDRHHQRFFSARQHRVGRSVYDNNPNNVQVGEILPPNCAQTQGGCAGPVGAP
jgi:hypothetical protein